MKINRWKKWRRASVTGAVSAALAVGLVAGAAGVVGSVPASASEGGPDDDGSTAIAGSALLGPGKVMGGTWANNGRGFGYQVTPAVMGSMFGSATGCVLEVAPLRFQAQGDYVHMTIHWSVKNVGTTACRIEKIIGSWIR